MAEQDTHSAESSGQSEGSKLTAELVQIAKDAAEKRIQDKDIAHTVAIESNEDRTKAAERRLDALGARSFREEAQILDDRTDISEEEKSALEQELFDQHKRETDARRKVYSSGLKKETNAWVPIDNQQLSYSGNDEFLGHEGEGAERSALKRAEKYDESAERVEFWAQKVAERPDLADGFSATDLANAEVYLNENLPQLLARTKGFIKNIEGMEQQKYISPEDVTLIYMHGIGYPSGNEEQDRGWEHLLETQPSIDVWRDFVEKSLKELETWAEEDREYITGKFKEIGGEDALKRLESQE